MLRKFLSMAPFRAYRGGPGARLPVLMYHRVLPEADALQPGLHTAKGVNVQFETLAKWFKVLPFDEAVALLREGRLPPRAVSITFDDGYRDNHDVAFPLLRRHGLSATFYVATGFLDGGRMFNDTALEAVRRAPTGMLDLSHWGLAPLPISDAASRMLAVRQIVKAIKYFSFDQRQAFCQELARHTESPLPGDVMMSSEQVVAMSRGGMAIGGHTSHHPILSKIDDALAMQEIVGNREVIRGLTGRLPNTFAYPNGKPGLDYEAKHVQMVRKAGYEAAASTATGVCDRHVDTFQVPRFVLTEGSSAGVLLRMMRIVSHLNRDRA